MSRPFLVVRASIDPAVMEEFLRWYRREHLPKALRIPGVIQAYRPICQRRGINWSVAYELENDSKIQQALTSPEAEAARLDWERWLPHISELTVDVYTGLVPLAPYHHWN